MDIQLYCFYPPSPYAAVVLAKSYSHFIGKFDRCIRWTLDFRG